MDEQLSRMEAKLWALDDRLRKAEVDAAEMRGRLADRPTTWTMLIAMFAAQIGVAISVALVFWAIPSR